MIVLLVEGSFVEDEERTSRFLGRSTFGSVLEGLPDVDCVGLQTWSRIVCITPRFATLAYIFAFKGPPLLGLHLVR